MTTRFHIDDEARALQILVASDYNGVPADIVSDLLLEYDWSEGEDHQRWINEAPIPEVVSWLEELCRDRSGLIANYERALADRYGDGWRDRPQAL